ncbi:MAG: c-type cytochrome [Terriglobales bacterium]
MPLRPLRDFSLRAFAVTLLAVSVAAWVQKPASKTPTLPLGSGRSAVIAQCSQCHGLRRIIAAHLDRAGWENVVDDMVQRGADLTDAQVKIIVSYLALHFPKQRHPDPGLNHE